MAQLSTRSNIPLGKGERKKSLWGDVLVGAAPGLIFSICSPTYFVVSAVLPPVSPVFGMNYLLTFTLGLCLSLLAVTFLRQKLMKKLGVA